MNFPKTIYISIEDDGNEKYLQVIDNIGDAENLWPQGTVGIYELKETMRVNWTYETKRIKKGG